MVEACAESRERSRSFTPPTPRTGTVHGAPKRCVQNDTPSEVLAAVGPRLLGGNVRVIDFEKALATLDTAHQLALILSYRDRAGHGATAAALGRLADVLDRRDLLCVAGWATIGKFKILWREAGALES